MAQDKLYQAMKAIAKSNGFKASPEHDLYRMHPPYFLNAFYWELTDKKAGKMAMNVSYDVKYPYFDDLKLYITDPCSDIKMTDKVRANSVIMVHSRIEDEKFEFDHDRSDGSYTRIAEKTFERIEKWYRDFFAKVNAMPDDLEGFFTSSCEKYPMQALFVYLHKECYDKAAECLKLLPDKLHSLRTIIPQNDEQVQRLLDSGAEKTGNTFFRDDMDCIIDYIAAKKNGLEWTADRARCGLLREERK
ncbi:MAG: hypothetical protein ILP19_04225 [Oscillospiraceae bacterium]|nr:hypothetical protein [Oscillospiraceae bacterium]